MLKKIYKAKWIRALRSGKYKQAQEILYDPKTRGYCCLGVAKRIFKLKKYTCKNEVSDEVLSAKSLEQMRLTDKEQRTLASMNDEGRTFEQIANYIQKHL